MLGIWGDPQRYLDTYWSRWGGSAYFAGDGAKRDADGYFWVLGRVDDVMNVAGHRIGTMEVESALVDHSAWRRRRWWACPTRSRERASWPS
jgi:acetyl-CoA synthetase